MNLNIWGHEVVFVEKNPEERCWVVSTADTHQHIVTIPWADAFKGYTTTQAPNYVAAINACQSDPKTKLTPKEEALARGEHERAVTPRETPKVDNVLSLDAFRKRRK